MKSLELHKNKLFWIITALSALLSLVCLLFIIKPNREYSVEGDVVVDASMRNVPATVYEGIHLTPGVYEVELIYDTDMDRSAVCSLHDGTVFYGGLLTNGEHLYQNLHKTGYQAWLFESTDHLQVTIEAGEKGEITTHGVCVRETNLLWTALLVVIWFVAGVFYAALLFGLYDKKYGVSIEKKQAIFFVIVIGFLASLPYLRQDVISGADLTYHLQRIEGVKDGFLNGQFPVRLEPRWLYDHGYANAIFYCNLLLTFPAILRMLGFTVTASYSIFCIALNLLGTFIAYYCFAKIFDNHKIGILCSFLYELSVFRIYKLTITSAVGEGTANTFLPLIIYGYYRVFSEDPKEKKYKSCWLPLALGYAGLMQTHVLTCEITGFLTILLCLIFVRKILNFRVFWELFKGASMAVLLSFWYLIPFLDYYVTQDVHIKHVSGRTIQERGLLPAQLAFLYWKDGVNTPLGDNGMQYSHPVGIGLVLLLGLVLFFILWYVGKVKQWEKKYRVLCITTALFGAMLCVMSLNVFPWDTIQNSGKVAASLVSGLQFPNRFLGWGTAMAVTVFGGITLQYFKKNRQIYGVLLLVAVVGTGLCGVHLLNYVDENQTSFYLYNEEGMGFGYISGAEYLIQGTQEELLTFEGPKGSKNVEIHQYEQKGTEARVACDNLRDKQGYIDFPLLMYKGYGAIDVQSGVEMPIGHGDNHLVRVSLPANYCGEILVVFESPLYWRASEVISLLAVVAVITFMWATFGERRKGQKKNGEEEVGYEKA